MNPIIVRKDNRYRRGNVVLKDGEYRGHESDVSIKVANYPAVNTVYLPPECMIRALNPPIIVSEALGRAIKHELENQ